MQKDMDHLKDKVNKKKSNLYSSGRPTRPERFTAELVDKLTWDGIQKRIRKEAGRGSREYTFITLTSEHESKLKELGFNIRHGTWIDGSTTYIISW